MNDYTKLINSIKLKSKISPFIFIAIETLLFFALPSIVYFIIVSLFVFCVYILIIAKIYKPISNSLENECDPHKFKELFFSSANKKISGLSTLSANFNISFLTGDFDCAIDYANQMIADGRFNSVISGLSNKAIAEFFKGDYSALKDTVKKYSEKISQLMQIKRNEVVVYSSNETRLKLYIAIADNDIKSVSQLSEQLKITNDTKLSRVQISFLKSVSSYLLNDSDTMSINCEYVKKYGSKTIYLSQLNKFIK